MSLRLNAVAVYRTTRPAEAVDYNSVVFQRDDLPVGSIVAEDVEGNFYLWTSPVFKGLHKKGSWPQKTGGTISLWRDHWASASATREQMNRYLSDLKEKAWPEGTVYPHVASDSVALFNSGLTIIV